MNSKNFNLMAILLLLTISSCGVAKRLDIHKQAPDEYLVVKQPPLVIPSKFELVKPINPADISTKSITEKEVDNILFQDQSPKKISQKTLSKSDQSFIKKTNKHKKEKDIKKLIQQEKKKNKKKKGLFS